jgi:hypothetical protein
MDASEAIEHQWPYLLAFLPRRDVIERLAAETGAFRRVREIGSAETLLRLAFVYGFCGLSLRATAAWAEASGVAHVSDVALLKRFRASSDWLLALLAAKIESRVPLPLTGPAAPLRVRLLDATTVSKPGSTGTDWRLHVAYDLAERRVTSLEITDRSGGESLQRFNIRPGELAVADRAYATRSGFASVLNGGGNFLVRLPWSNVPLEEADGVPFDLLGWLRSLPDATASERSVQVRLPKGPLAAVRVLAIRKSEVAAENAREKALRNQSKHGQKTDMRSLEAAGYVILLTNLEADRLSASAGLDLYRFRWQIEICFKHLKSLIALDSLPAKGSQLAITHLAAKILAALVIEDFTARYVSFFPWGYPAKGTPDFVLASA